MYNIGMFFTSLPKDHWLQLSQFALLEPHRGYKSQNMNSHLASEWQCGFPGCRSWKKYFFFNFSKMEWNLYLHWLLFASLKKTYFSARQSSPWQDAAHLDIRLRWRVNPILVQRVKLIQLKKSQFIDFGRELNQSNKKVVWSLWYPHKTNPFKTREMSKAFYKNQDWGSNRFHQNQNKKLIPYGETFKYRRSWC